MHNNAVLEMRPISCFTRKQSNWSSFLYIVCEIGARAETSTRTKGAEGYETEGVRGLKALGVRDLSYRLAFLACSVSSSNPRVSVYCSPSLLGMCDNTGIPIYCDSLIKNIVSRYVFSILVYRRLRGLSVKFVDNLDKNWQTLVKYVKLPFSLASCFLLICKFLYHLHSNEPHITMFSWLFMEFMGLYGCFSVIYKAILKKLFFCSNATDSLKTIRLKFFFNRFRGTIFFFTFHFYPIDIFCTSRL